MFNRRDLLKALAATSIGSLVPRAAGAETKPTRTRPRYYVFVYFQGGIDAIFTTDPKTRAEVAADVDVPFPPDAIKTFGAHRVGPHLAMLGDTVKDLTIINGVHTHVLNHISGFRQFLRLKLNADGRMPTAMHVLGAHRDTQAVGEIYIDTKGSPNGVFSPSFLGSIPGEANFFDLLDGTAPEDLRRLARTYRGQIDRLGRADRLAPEQLTTKANIEEAARFFERVADVAPFKLQPWDVKPPPLPPGVTLGGAATPKSGPPPPKKRGSATSRMQRALWLLEHDLAATVFVQQGVWDSHSGNTEWQTREANQAYPALARFFEGLRTRRNKFGVLADQTVVFLASELGRFPKTNVYAGKDHFPEAPVIMYGPHLRKGVFGATGKLMEAQPISLATGLPARGGTKISLDDVSATLLSLAGIDPVSYGYYGRHLEFMLA